MPKTAVKRPENRKIKPYKPGHPGRSIYKPAGQKMLDQLEMEEHRDLDKPLNRKNKKGK